MKLNMEYKSYVKLVWLFCCYTFPISSKFTGPKLGSWILITISLRKKLAVESGEGGGILVGFWDPN